MVAPEKESQSGFFRDRKFILLCVLFVLTIPLITPRLYSGDEIQYFAYLRSVWKDGDLHFLNEYTWLYQQAPKKQENFRKAFVDRLNKTGYARNDAPIGCAILWTPFFAIADVYSKFSGRFPDDGFSFPYIAMICFGSALYGFTGFLFQYKIGRQYFSDYSAFWAVLSLWFGAHALFYMYVTPPMSHATSIFTTSLFLYLWLKIRKLDSYKWWIVLGIAGGFAAIVRWQDAFFLLLPLFDRQPARLKIIFAITALLLFIPQLWTWQILNGELTPYSTGNLKGKFFWYGKYLIPVLFSTYHGLFLWTPITALCIWGFYYLIQREKLFQLLILIFAIQLYLIICIDTWQGGAGFGLRYIISCTAIFTLGLTALYNRWKSSIVPAVAIVFIVWNIFLVIQVSTGMLPRDGHFPVSKMIHNQFVEVPKRLGNIVYRYLFDRSSFYNQQ